MSNEELYEKAKDAIMDLFSDMSVSPEQAKENLETLVEEIQILIDTLPVD